MENIKKIFLFIQRLKISNPITISILLHVSLFFFLLFSFPQCQKSKPQEVIISLDLLPISKKTNVENKKKTEPKRVEEKQANPSRAAVSEPTKEKESPAEKQQVVKHKEEPKEVIKSPEKPKKPAVKETKPIAKKTEAKKPAKKQTAPKPNEYDTLLKNLLADTSAEEELEKKIDKTSKGPYDADRPLSMGIKDSIRKQIEKCWNPPAGNKDAGALKILVQISFKQDGTVEQVKLVDMAKYNSNELYRVAADAALRAVYKASPLQDLPVDQYDSWKNIEFYFDPSNLIY